MRLTSDARAILGQSSIGMLALRAGRLPLVNPAVFSFAAGSLWMTTSRFAAKTMLARPGYVLGMAGYALKKAPFVAGYILDITRLPREWLPYNRVVMRLRPSHADVIEGIEFPPAQAARVPAVPADVSRRLAGVSRGYACWIEAGMPFIRPAFWDVDGGQVTVAPASGRPRTGLPGALVVELHHRFRPSLMVGACVRGTFGGAADPTGIAERYGLEPDDVPSALELRAERVTSWRGFAISTAVPRSARNLMVAQA